MRYAVPPLDFDFFQHGSSRAESRDRSRPVVALVQHDEAQLPSVDAPRSVDLVKESARAAKRIIAETADGPRQGSLLANEDVVGLSNNRDSWSRAGASDCAENTAE